MIRRALISVSDKQGLEDIALALGELNTEIVSSGGTAKRLRELGYGKLTEVSDYTGFPESPGGLLKTLHPLVHGGILLSREIPEHRTYMEAHEIEPFEMVVVNLYPFESTVAKGAALHEAAENIDIGGPTMIRSAAKAALLYGKVTVVTDPSQYNGVAETLRHNNGEVPPKMVRELAEKAFARTAAYDSAIVSYLAKGGKVK